MSLVTRYSTLQHGAMIFTGNTLGLTPTSGSNIQAFITTDTGQTAPGYPAGSTLLWQNNRSSAQLTIPAGSTILYAELQWGGTSLTPTEDVRASIDTPINFTTPAGTFPLSSDTATAQVFNFTAVGSPAQFYSRSTDVTALLQAGGSGTYSVAGVASTIVANPTGVNAAGWTLGIIYENPSLPTRNMSIYSGIEGILAGNPPTDVNVTGFLAPPSGTVNARVLASAIEGDSLATGDQMLMGPSTGSLVALSGPNNSSSNFFASQVNNGNSESPTVGQLDTTGTFGTRNVTPGASPTQAVRYGWDITNVRATNFVNNQSTAVVRITSAGDTYGLPLLGIQLDAVELADISVVKTDSPDPAIAGQTLSYTMVVSNAGPSDALAVTLTDAVPASILNPQYSLTGGAPFTPWTGSLNLGTIASGGSINVLIQGTIDPSVTGTITNTATVSSTTVDPDPTNNTSTTNTTVEIPADISVVKTDSPDPVIAGDTLSYTMVVSNAGPAAAQNVTLTDPVPASIINPQYSLTGGAPFTPWTGSLNLGTIGIGASVTVLIQGTVDPGATGTITNTATVSSTTPDQDPTNNTSTVDTTVNTSADISVVKTDSPDPVIAGEVLTYTMVVSNGGPSDALAVTLTDAVPASILNPQYSLTGGAPFTPWPGSLNLGTIASGGAITVLIQGTVDPSATGTITNTATVTSSTPDPDPTNNTSTVDTTVNTSADVSVVKTDSPDPVIAGEVLTYTMVVSNAGPSDALGVTLTDPVPASILNPQYSLTGGAPFTPWPGSLNLGTIATGGSITVLIQGTVDPATTGTITNTATVTSSTSDPNPTNNTSTVNTTVNTLADISVVKTDSPDPVIAGQSTLTYTMVVSNAGPSDALAVTLTDAVPGSILSPQYSLTGGAPFTPWPGSLNLGTIATGGSITVLIQGTVAPSATGTITNTATVTSSTPDPDPTNNTSTVDTTVNTSADISVVKTDSPDPVIAGEVLTYTMVVSNGGPSDALGVTLTDPVPGSILNPQYSLTGGAPFTPWPGSLNLGTIASGGSITVLIQGTVDPSTTGTITNTATVTSSTPDPDPTNNTSTVDTTVNTSADISVVKTDSPDPVIAGEVLTYTMVVSNGGPSDALAVTLTDAVPGTILSPQYSLTGGAPFTPWAGSINLGTIASGGSISVLIQGTVDPSTTGTITNTATVTSSTPDPDPTNNTSTIDTTVNTSADISVVKTDSPDPVIAGEVLTYTMVVSNGGPSDALAVTLTDAVPGSILSPQYSLTGGAPFTPWPGSLNLGTIASGGSITVLIQGTVDPAATGTITNTATVTSSTSDPDPTNNTFTVDTTVNTLADISVVKTDSPDPVIAGEVLTYTMVVSNGGPSDALEVTLTDAVPGAILTPQYSLTGGAPFTPWPGSLNLGTIAAGGAITVLIQGTVDPAATGTITNTATVTSSTSDPDPTNNTSTVDTTVNTSADVSVVKTDSPDPVIAGEVLTYTMVVSNGGPSDALGVTLTDAVPGSILSPQYSLTGGAPFTPWPGSLNLGTIATGGSITVLIQGTVDPATTGTITNTATVTSSTPDPDPTNNTSTVDTTVNTLADISVVKTDSPDPVIAGEVLTYTMVVSNGGPSDALGVTLTDAPVSILSPQYSLTGGAPFTPWPGSLNLGTIASGGSITVLIQGIVDPSAIGTITNTATVTSSTPDPDPTNNTSTVDTTVNTLADISVVKTDSPDPVLAGQTLTYTEVVANAGPSDAQAVTLTDIVPTAIQNPEYSLDGGVTYTPWSGSISLGTIGAGSSRTVLIKGMAISLVEDTIINTATVNSTTSDPDQSNNTSTVPTTIIPAADISVVKTASPSPVIAGETLTYTEVVSNAGVSDAQDVTLTDAVPGTILNPEYSLDGGATYNPWGGSVSLGTLIAGASITVLIQGTVSPSATGIITNTAIVSSPTPDPDPSNNTSTVDTTVNTLADISVVKTGAPNPVIAGAQATYTAVVSNAGPSDAQSVTLTDAIPPTITDPEYSLDGGVTYIPWTGAINLGTMPVGDVISVLIRGTAGQKALGDITNTTIVTSPTPDPDPTNNTSTVTIVAVAATLEIAKAVDKGIVTVGGVLAYTIIISNTGTGTAKDVIFTDPIPAGTVFIQNSVTLGGVPDIGADPSLGIPLGDMAPGESITITFEVRSNDAITVNPVINEAGVNYMAKLCPTCVVQSVKTNSNTAASIIEPKTFKQLNVYGNLKIPSQKPDGEDVIDATVSAVITKIRIIKTPIGKSSDGKILTGWKAIIHGNLKQKVEYIADEPTQSVHLAHFCVPFSTFIVLPSDSQNCCPMTTVVTIEDVYATLLDKRTIFTNITLLIQGNICS